MAGSGKVVVAENRQLKFTPAEMERVGKCRAQVGTSYAEFIHWAVMQACDEIESTSDALATRRRQQASTDW